MELSKYISKVYMWMFIGLAITFLTGQCVANSPSMVMEIFGGKYILLVIAQLAVVIFLSIRIHKMSSLAAKVTFIVYSILTGLTFSSVFLAFKVESIIIIFIITAIIMLLLSLIGYFTNVDLTKIGTYLLIGLLIVIALSIINIFLKSASLDLGTSILAVIIFMAYIVYDMKMIKNIYYQDPNNENLAIFGAFQLYLDFINIFINLLQIFGENE